MLAVSSYSNDYVNGARATLEQELAAWERVAAASGEGAARVALRALEPLYFNNLVLALEARFVHRVRNREGKDGNALSEVRMIASSLMDGGAMGADKTIKLSAESSVVGYEVGEQIALGAEDFRKLADAFLAEIEAKYPA